MIYSLLSPVVEKRSMLDLRKATLADLPILMLWDEQSHVIESDPNDDWQWGMELGREVDWREQLVAEADGRPIGFVQIIDPVREESHYWGDVPENLRAIDIWIGMRDDLGKGYGTQIMEMTLDRCFADPQVEAIIIDPLESNTRAHQFYERIGFQYVDTRTFGPDTCYVYCLDRRDWEKRQ